MIRGNATLLGEVNSVGKGIVFVLLLLQGMDLEWIQSLLLPDYLYHPRRRRPKQALGLMFYGDAAKGGSTENVARRNRMVDNWTVTLNVLWQQSNYDCEIKMK